MDDREKKELAEVFAVILDVRMKELYSQIAKGFYYAIECFMEDLATILESNKDSYFKKIKEYQKELDDKAKKRKVGF